MTKDIFRFGANAETIKSTTDLFYLKSYEYFSGQLNIIYEAGKIFDETNDVYAVDTFLTKKKNAMLAEKYRKQANLSKRFKTRTFENFVQTTDIQKRAYKKAIEYAQNIESHIETGTNIIFIGQGCVGTGKTHLACAIANYVLDCGIPVIVLNVISLVNGLKEFTPTFKKELQSVKVLLIDDLGKENGTSWLCSEIYGIVNARYENELPTIITTEGNLNDLEDNYKVDVNGKVVNKGCSMVSRLSESCVGVLMSGEDFRAKKGEICKHN